jgi:hypothetical protein
MEFNLPKPENLPDPHTGTRQTTGHKDRHTDAQYLRRRFGMPRMPSFEEALEVMPAGADAPLTPKIYDHTWSGGAQRVSGGQGAFLVGPEGRGKTTLMRRLAAAEMEHNDSKTVWSAATGSRAGWLPFAPIARVCIPEGYETRSVLVPKEESANLPTVEVDLEDIAREVVTYRDVMDLNQRVLSSGMFHVVFADPELRGCQWIYEESDRRVANKRHEVEFTEEDPTDHWWFGWGLSLVERPLPGWVAWFYDEVQALAAEGVANDKFLTRMKVKLIGESMEDFRKNGIARYFAGHKYKHIHSLWSDRINWRIHTSGLSNPRLSYKGSIPSSLGGVPMEKDLMSDANIGDAILYDESSFEVIHWPAIPTPIKGDLKVFLDPESETGATSSGEVTA